MSNTSIDDVRKTIDDIDTQMHDLILRRVEAVAPLAALKAREGARDFMRPSREALILRRLIGRHRGPLPVETILGIWRTLISAKLQLQGAFSVHVYGPPGREMEFWDLARSYYGMTTPMALQGSAQGLVRAVADIQGVVGLLPVPSFNGETDAPWWRGLLSDIANSPKVVARLPFLTGDGVATTFPPAYCLACVTPEASGEDCTVIAVMTDAEVSRTAVQSRLAHHGIPAQVIATGLDPSGGDVRHYLCEAEGFIPGTDPRFGDVAREEGIRAAAAIGAYAVPVTLEA